MKWDRRRVKWDSFARIWDKSGTTSGLSGTGIGDCGTGLTSSGTEAGWVLSSVRPHSRQGGLAPAERRSLPHQVGSARSGSWDAVVVASWKAETRHAIFEFA